MANIWYGTTGDFSALTPKKIVSANWSLATSISSFAGSATNTARFMPFTPSEAGDCEGVLLPIRLLVSAVDQSASISLQETLGAVTVTIASPAVFTLASHGMSNGDQVTIATTGALPTGFNATTKYFVVNQATNTFELSLTSGGASINSSGTQSGTHTLWHDKRLVTMTYDAMVGAEHSAEFLGKSGCLAKYFEWSSVYALTADANKYKICVFSTNANCTWSYISGATTTYGHAVVISGTTSYSPSDDIYIRDNIALTIDQSVTAVNIIQGSNSALQWDTTPAGAYTLQVTDIWFHAMATFQVGTSTDRIPYSAQATLNITNFRTTFEWSGIGANEIEIYGELPGSMHSYVKTKALSGQKVVEIDDDFSATWTAGDSLAIFAGTSHAVRYDTIASVSGREVTMTNNLNTNHDVGYAVVNITRGGYYGVKLAKAFSTTTMTWYKFKISGLDTQTYGFSFSPNYSSGLQYQSTASLAKIEPFLFDNMRSTSTAISISANSQSISGTTNSYIANSIVSNIYHVNAAASSKLGIAFPVKFTFFNIFLGTYVNVATIGGNGHEITNLHMTSTWGSGGYYLLDTTGFNACTFTNCKFTGLLFNAFGVNNTYTNCSWDATGGLYFRGSAVANKFINCNFGQITANTYDFTPTPYFLQLDFQNCKFSTTPVKEADLSLQLSGSYFKADTFGTTANDHRSWWTYGKLVSTGDGLTDTTVRTSGTGKFALRFEPTSSTNNLTWDFTIPTGDISTKTMTVSMWVKINSATYYAGTHQNPRLTIDYDNGTTSYAEATDSTAWQLLTVSFTPTTSYGQITVTVSGKTDATSTDAYFYIDDFGVAYPPSVALDLGGMDNWSNALPVVPPISIPISANTVAESVWRQLTASSWGTGSFGEYIKTLTPDERIKFIVDGELPLY